jgi:hypothetical protein
LTSPGRPGLGRAAISSDVSSNGPHPDLASDFALFCQTIVPAIT